MTAPASGGQSPLKIAGIALIGVGVVAAVVGLIGLTGGGEDGGNQAAPPSASAEPAPAPAPAPGDGTGDGAAPGTGGTPAPGTPGETSPFTPGAPGTPGSPGYDGAGPAVAAPPAAGSGSAGQGGSGSAAGEGSAVAARPVVRIYNNSTIRGLAEKAAGEFRTNGWTVSQVQNYSQGVIPTTTVYYRQGTDEKAAAEEIAKKFGIRSEPRFDGIQDATPGVIVIVTRDFSAA
ncbi:LytR C-terminal domain-containing protein [Pseudonocardia sp. DR1-2]|uniref:LytR C-terminal domain-containing protein n=1 Tax=Pseudonocardia sp. DR1-2 TaxID=2951168 RepID=UPI0020447FE8|nr:LytR C-terminal domain-containing protein [Pseudonocardia sp. DR1-2]MCM3845442.1 LytR C-terminal domain-containing protein [Pseudonocardia sp. DR1-2]